MIGTVIQRFNNWALHRTRQKPFDGNLPCGISFSFKHGMIIAFDDYHCWSPTQLSGERRAKLELVSDHEKWHLEPFLKYGWHGHSFVVEDKRLLDSIGR